MKRAELLGVAAAVLASLLLGGCEVPGPEPGLSMLGAVRDHSTAVGDANAAGFGFTAEPKVERVTFAEETRTAVVTTADGWRWRGRVPDHANLYLGLQRAVRAPDASSQLELHLRLRSSAKEEQLSRKLDIGVGSLYWNDSATDLGSYAGAEVEIAASVVGPDGRVPSLPIVWSPVILSAQRPRPAAERPSVILVVIDTLRADHLGSYGYARSTSPQIDRRLAQQGVLFERAYSQAPWTLPSVASLHSGLPPAAVCGSQGSTCRLPESAPVLAERFAALGYDTAAFIANPVLHGGLGYDRGFDTFYVPRELDAINTSATSAGALQQKVEPWLRAHRERPFFLYVHYLDPHSPYENPEIVDGRSRFFPDYHGRLTGRQVHGLMLGRVGLEDPEADVAHLTALYDSEIAYVDGYVGRLLDLAEQRGDRDLLVALTADHGEELYDHRGWDHSLTLYDELVHVPLILRRPHDLPRGERYAAPVELLDLAPTLLAAAGGETPQAWHGADLRALASGTRSPLARPIFAERVESWDPRRVAVIAGDRKLILFDRRAAESLDVRKENQQILQAQALRRFAARELYDLARDPHERVNLAGEGGGELEAQIHRYLDSFLPGLRVVARGLEAGAVLEAEIELDHPPKRWQSLFLGPNDRVETNGASVRIRYEGDGWIKGIRLEGDQLAVRAIRIPDTAPAKVRVVSGATSYGGGPLDAAALRTEKWPLDVAGPVLAVWLRGATSDQPEPENLDEETARRLRALGYVP